MMQAWWQTAGEEERLGFTWACAPKKGPFLSQGLTGEARRRAAGELGRGGLDSS